MNQVVRQSVSQAILTVQRATTNVPGRCRQKHRERLDNSLATCFFSDFMGFLDGFEAHTCFNHVSVLHERAVVSLLISHLLKIEE